MSQLTDKFTQESNKSLYDKAGMLSDVKLVKFLYKKLNLEETNQNITFIKPKDINMKVGFNQIYLTNSHEIYVSYDVLILIQYMFNVFFTDLQFSKTISYNLLKQENIKEKIIKKRATKDKPENKDDEEIVEEQPEQEKPKKESKDKSTKEDKPKKEPKKEDKDKEDKPKKESKKEDKDKEDKPKKDKKTKPKQIQDVVNEQDIDEEQILQFDDEM